MIAVAMKYKKTGIDWMPEVPEHWEVRRMKNICFLQRGHDLSKEKFLEGGYPVYGSNGIIGYHKEFSTKAPCITIGRSGSTGEIQFVEDDFWAHNTCLFVKESYGNNWRYLYYLLSSIDIKRVSNGTAVPTLDRNNVHVLKVGYPPPEEQKAIADYLDTQSAKITHFIQTKQRFIELLKEQRQSIIEIALKSEESWTKSKIKHISKMFGRIGFRGYQTSDLVDKGKGAITISPSNMKDNKMNFNQCSYLSWVKYEESPEIKIFQGDILFVKTGATYGKVALVPELPEKATINPQLMVFKELKIDAEYFCYYLQTGYIKEQVEKTVIGGTIPTISQTKVGTFQVYYPNPDEQKQIVEHIKSETKTLDIAISKAEREIELIKEYREAMIAEAVTGKMK